MAVVANTVTILETLYGHAHQVAWAGLTQTSSDSGDPILMPGSGDRSVQVTGTFGAGGTVIIEGSNDGGTTYAELRDPQGALLTFTASTLKQISELSGWIRPRVTGGDGSTSLNVYLVLRRSL